MTTMTPIADIDIVEILQSDEAPCQRFDCDRAAEWAWRCPRCNQDRHVCDEHRRMFDRDNHRTRFVCSWSRGCLELTPDPVPWRQI